MVTAAFSGRTRYVPFVCKIVTMGFKVSKALYQMSDFYKILYTILCTGNIIQ